MLCIANVSHISDKKKADPKSGFLMRFALNQMCFRRLNYICIAVR